MNVLKDILYTADHLWVKKEQNYVRIGLTPYAQSEIGDILLVELPEPGSQVARGENFVVIETAKAVFDIKSPVSGSISEVNAILDKKPEWIKGDPYGDGWMVVINLDLSEGLAHLMDAEAYEAFLEGAGDL
jgi:glycine cleavage system H protein